MVGADHAPVDLGHEVAAQLGADKTAAHSCGHNGRVRALSFRFQGQTAIEADDRARCRADRRRAADDVRLGFHAAILATS